MGSLCCCRRCAAGTSRLAVQARGTRYSSLQQAERTQGARSRLATRRLNISKPLSLSGDISRFHATDTTCVPSSRCFALASACSLSPRSLSRTISAFSVASPSWSQALQAALPFKTKPKLDPQQPKPKKKARQATNYDSPAHYYLLKRIATHSCEPSFLASLELLPFSQVTQLKCHRSACMCF
eukprot:3674495-Pleurochrysis_carterae.AAC.3